MALPGLPNPTESTNNIFPTSGLGQEAQPGAAGRGRGKLGFPTVRRRFPSQQGKEVFVCCLKRCCRGEMYVQFSHQSDLGSNKGVDGI